MKWREVKSKMLPPGARALVSGDVRAVVSLDDGRWHLSVSCEHRYPRWRELRDARYDLIPDNVYMAQILPPKDHYVNVHPNCFHLWQIDPPSIP